MPSKIEVPRDVHLLSLFSVGTFFFDMHLKSKVKSEGIARKLIPTIGEISEKIVICPLFSGLLGYVFTYMNESW